MNQVHEEKKDAKRNVEVATRKKEKLEKQQITKKYIEHVMAIKILSHVIVDEELHNVEPLSSTIITHNL
jgi:hypothetical protein